MLQARGLLFRPLRQIGRTEGDFAGGGGDFAGCGGDRLQRVLQAGHGAIEIVPDQPVSVWKIGKPEGEVALGQAFERVRERVGDERLFRGSLRPRGLRDALRFDGVVDDARRNAKRALQPTFENEPVVGIAADGFHARRRLANEGVTTVDHVVDRKLRLRQNAGFFDVCQPRFEIAAADVATDRGNSFQDPCVSVPFRKLQRLAFPQVQQQKAGAGGTDQQRRTLQHRIGGKSRGRGSDQ